MYSEENEQYSDIMSVCKDMIKSSEKEILEYVGEVCACFSDNMIVVADFCTADGGNSLPILDKITAKIKNSSEKEVLLVFEDQPCNDFNSLVGNIVGKPCSTDKKLLEKNTYAMVCGKDMYKQCLPSNFAHFIFSGFGFHWLSASTVKLSNGLFYNDVSNTESERRLIVNQAARDWDNLLRHREIEMKPGGVMYTMMLVSDDDGQYASMKFHQLLSDVHREIFEEGHIQKAEFESAYFTFYNRSEQEIRKPFEQNNLKLQLCMFRKREWTCFRKKCKMSCKENRDWAERVTKLTKVWSYKTIAESLVCQNENQREITLELYYNKYFERLLVFPYDLAYTIADVVIKKPNNHVIID